MKIFYRLGVAVICITAGTMVYAFYLFIFPLDIVKINNIPYPVLKQVVVAGTNVEYRSDFCAYAVATAQLVQYFEDTDGRLIILSPKAFTTSVGCFTPIGTVLVPDTTPPGTYTLHTAATYAVNPLHSIIVTSVTQPFTVTSPTK